MVCIGPLVALLDLQKLLACFIRISSLSLVLLITGDKITPLPLKHLSFQLSVQGTCSFKPVAELVASLGTASRLWSMMLVLRLPPALLQPLLGGAASQLPQKCFWNLTAMPGSSDGEGKRHKIGGGTCWAHLVDLQVWSPLLPCGAGLLHQVFAAVLQKPS